MAHYMRNSFTQIAFLEEDLLITGGRYQKRVRATSLMIEILKMTGQPMQEEKLINKLQNKFQISQERLKEYLEKLSDLGFLEKDVIYICKQEHEKYQDIQSEICSFNVPTYQRKEELKRCLESYIQNFKEYGHVLKYYIYDDTNVYKDYVNSKFLQEIVNANQVSISCIGLKEKKELINLLAKDFKRELIEFSFLPSNLFQKKKYFMAGANRNCILAYNAGENFLMADDDSLCKGIKEEKSSCLMFSIGRGSIEKSNITYEHLKKLTKDLRCDLIKEHKQFLGKRLGQLLKEKQISKIDYNMIESQNVIFPNAYDLYCDSKIAFTFHSILGWPDQTADEVIRESLKYNNIDFLMGKDNQYIRECVKGNVIYAKAHLLTTTLTGMTGEEILVPFMPVYKNEDIHFSYFLNYIQPYGLSCGLQQNLLHNKTSMSDQLANFYNHFYGDIVFSYVLLELLKKLKSNIPEKYMPISVRIKILAQYIQEVCGKNEKDFVANILSLKIDLEKLYVEKKFYIDELKRTFSINLELYQMKNGYNGLKSYHDFLIHSEWKAMRKVLIYYVQLLTQWKDILQACHELRKKEQLPEQNVRWRG